MNDYNKRVKYLVVNFGELKDKPLKTNIRDARMGYNNLEKAYSEGTQLKDIKNHIFTSVDSINIAKTRYDFMEIAKNEMKEERKEDMFNNLIPFPYEKDTDISIRLDTVLNGEHDFIFHYKQKYPVTIGLKKLAVTMASKVDALDRSSFTLDKADTLSYFIASLSQLIDTATVYKTTHRDVYNKLSTDIKFKKNTPSFDINYNSNKIQIDTLLYTYNTFASESNLIIDSLSIYVSTSLNGNFDKNYQLSQKRAESLKKYLASKIELSDSLIITKGTGEDWNTFAKLILSNKNIQNKDEIIKMLENAVIPDETKDKIKKDYPADFKYITDSIYPKLDKVDVIINMHRPNMNDKVVTEAVIRPNYEKGLALLADRDYWAALEILSQYPDYNTALCLVCMGYNVKAKELLDKLPITANNEYLLAIINTRSENEEQAIKHLLKACELDKNKLFRIKLDPEINELVNKHNLNDRLVINN